MQSHTHAAVGACIGAALTIQSPIEVAAAGTAVTVLGAIISDIDVGGTGKRSTPWLVAGCSAALLSVPIVLGMMKHPVALALLLATCIYGAIKPHRTFLHSLAAFVLLNVGMYFLAPTMTVYFAAGFLSHLLLDIITHRPVQLYYPIEKGVSLKLCYSKSKLSRNVFIVGCLGTIMILLIRFIMIL